MSITIGTFTRKIEPHQKCSSRNPPASGPMATPRPDTPAQIAMARARSPGCVNTLVRIESVAGMMNAAPNPCSARIAIRALGESTSEHSEPVPNTTRPNRKQPLRPRRSPVLPTMRRKLAKTMVYASTIHCSSSLDRADLAHQGGQRHVDDGAVDAHDEQPEAQHHEDVPALGSARCSTRVATACTIRGGYVATVGPVNPKAADETATASS